MLMASTRTWLCVAMLAATALSGVKAECTATDCATCITQTEPGALFGTSPCTFCALGNVCTASLTATCVEGAEGAGWNRDTCEPMCPGNPNCPTCDAKQISNSDHATAETACEAGQPQGATCSIECADTFSGGGQITCEQDGDGVAWSTVTCTADPPPPPPPPQASFDCWCARRCGYSCNVGLKQNGEEEPGTLAGTVQADALSGTDGLSRTDAQAQCASQYPEKCEACTASGTSDDTLASHDGECYACPHGQIWTSMSSQCVAPPPPPPPAPSEGEAAEDATYAACFLQLNVAGDCDAEAKACTESPAGAGSCTDECQGYVDCLYDGCPRPGMNEGTACKDPARFRLSTGIIIGLAIASVCHHLQNPLSLCKQRHEMCRSVT